MTSSGRAVNFDLLMLVPPFLGSPAASNYFHEMRLVIDAGGSDSIYVSKDLWVDEPAEVRQGRFWAWAKRAQEKYWEASHS
jgi:hypothetical protein